MDALIAQCRRALFWIADHIGEHGGDADQITISGHSAGAHIAAMMLASDWKKETGRAMPPLRHVCVLSGIFELEPIRLCFLNDVLGLQLDEVARYSPRLLQRQEWTPLSVVVGADEGEEYLRQTREFVGAWTGAKDCPREVVIQGINHFSMREQLGVPGSEVVSLALGNY